MVGKNERGKIDEQNRSAFNQLVNGLGKGAGLEALAKLLDRVPNLTQVLNVQSHVERRNCPGGAFWNVNNRKDINNDNSSEVGVEKRDISFV